MTARLKYMPMAMDYARKAMSREALLEPIKLQRDIGKKANTRRKKEKKAQGLKKENVIPRYVTVHNSKNIDDKKCFQQLKGSRGEANGWYPKKLEDEAKQLEKSDITEEHEPPASTENNCYLSDGTQSSQKRKRPLIIRIKLRKPDASLAPSPDASLAPSTSGRAEAIAPNQPSAETKVEHGRVASKFDQELSPPAPEGSETTGQKRIGGTSCEDQIQTEELQHANLIENWIPPPAQFSLNDVGDEDWLFETKQQTSCGSKRYKPNNEVSCCTSSTLWPQAQLLPEAGVYALPFTVPF